MSTEDDDKEGMDSAVERARSSGGRDVFGVLDDDAPSMDDAVERARKTGGQDVYGVLDGLNDKPPAQTAAEAAAPEPKEAPKSTFGPVEPPPPAPADVAPPPPGPPEQDFAQYAPPKPAASDDEVSARKALRMKALKQASDMLSGTHASTPSAPDADLLAAQGRDREQRQKNDFTEAIQAWLMRRPARFSEPQEAADLMAARAAAKPKGTNSELSAAVLRAALGGEQKPEGLSPYQQIEVARQKLEDERRAKEGADKKAAEDAALDADRKILSARLGKDLSGLSRKGIDELTSGLNAEANQSLAGSKFAHDLSEDAAKKKAVEAARAAGAVNFRGSKYEIPNGMDPDSTDLRQFRTKASASSTVISQLDEVAKDVKALIANPTDRSARARVESRQGLIAPLINVAVGQGAMSAPEYDRVKQSMGDIGSAGFWADAITRALGDPAEAATLLQRVQTAQQFFDDGVRQQAGVLGLGGNVPAASGGTVTVIDTKTGTKKTLTRERAAKYLADPRFKETPGG